ncbi:DUF6453 family protein [Yersinia ruckeri]|uniref:DUF6453 family protein n=1 Tax=Yersinia ruckeri TaxID=29486 RepID=UPI0004E3714B|nr:DUF6453 family protein [Yersinia ruckeri]ARZ01303.1 hypothetical protein QMA0440_01970 [Yersinia ruckeri]EKN4700348.1 hypothetical protein [Yersinia ruckeri]ELM3740217.1 hypothetical protein [Yersinia ruckeri]KFE37352.1 hypothetical protein nADLYRO1b_3311 [Yersinia ruckeri]MCW6545388.1 DUF6453 family protein [Yersinia ruckeri]
MGYGIQIQPGDGGKPVNITTTARAASYLGEYNPPFNNQGGATTVQIPGWIPGAQLFVLPIRTAITYQPPMSPVVLTMNASSISIVNDLVHIQLKGFRYPADRGDRPVIFRCMQVMAGQSSGGNYGIALQDATNYAEINDASIAGFCVWRGEVQIAPNWRVPDSVQFRQNCTVFAHWNSPDVTLDFDEASKTISGWRRQGDIYTSQNNINITAQVCIFSNGAPPLPPRYGLAIWNKQGQCTFSSDFAPLLLRGIINVQRGPGQYTGAPAGVGRMMVPLSRLGVHELRTNGLVNNFFAGMRMSGNAITAFLGRKNTHYIASDYWIDFAITQLPLPVIDANDYF